MAIDFILKNAIVQIFLKTLIDNCGQIFVKRFFLKYTNILNIFLPLDLSLQIFKLDQNLVLEKKIFITILCRKKHLN